MARAVGDDWGGAAGRREHVYRFRVVGAVGGARGDAWVGTAGGDIWRGAKGDAVIHALGRSSRKSRKELTWVPVKDAGRVVGAAGGARSGARGGTAGIAGDA